MSGKTLVVLLVVSVSVVSANRICRELGNNVRAVGEGQYHDKITYSPAQDVNDSANDCQKRCYDRQQCTAAYFKHHLLWYTCWLYDNGNHKPIKVQEDTGFPEVTIICGEEQQITQEKNYWLKQIVN